MFFNPDDYEYYISPGITDMRGGIGRLASHVQNVMKLNPFSGKAMFLFCGRDRRNVKVLLWDRNGFWLLQKKLNMGTFRWPDTTEDSMRVTKEDIRRLLAGEDVFRKLPNLGSELVL